MSVRNQPSFSNSAMFYLHGKLTNARWPNTPFGYALVNVLIHFKLEREHPYVS